MSDTVIEIDNLWKKYRLGVMGTGTLRHDFNRWWHRVRGKSDPYTKVGQVQKSEVTFDPSLADDEMWALKDVCLEVKQGEIVGIIGRNGAGKSTLLKILSRVTAPTGGEVRVKGRIASLLEVGTGFHAELTGRENIYLNGAILGMTRGEIQDKFDEIVTFANIEKFLDTPVKRYSSGMYVRLAFAVAAHLDPEILIIDEVLAVGDAEFQKKCLGKMSEVAHGGRTVLFVSHNLEAVRKLCSVGVLLEEGKLTLRGSVDNIISTYIDSRVSWKTTFAVPPPTDEDVPAFATKISVEDVDSTPTNGFVVGKPWQVRVSFSVLRRVEHFIVAIGLTSERGVPVWTVWSKPREFKPGTYTAIFRNEQIYLCSGAYTINVGLSVYERPVHYVESAGVLGVAEVTMDANALRITGGSGFILNSMPHSITQA